LDTRIYGSLEASWRDRRAVFHGSRSKARSCVWGQEAPSQVQYRNLDGNGGKDDAKGEESFGSFTERGHSMRNPKFKEIKPNYRKNVLEITLRDGKKIKSYSLPFAVFRDVKISSRNRFTSITIDRELGNQAVSFVLEDASKGEFPADLVLYYCDPTYHWSPLNQLKSALKDKISTSRLSVRVIADALDTSASQVARLLQENKASKHIVQLIRLAELAGYQIEFSLKKKRAA
jgi:hypothetical protein